MDDALSNQRPLPCEGRALPPCVFAAVQKHLQNGILYLRTLRACSPSFAWVGVLLVYMRCKSTLRFDLSEPIPRGDRELHR